MLIRKYCFRYWRLILITLFPFMHLCAQTVYPVQVKAYPLINATVYLSDLTNLPFNRLKPMFELTLRDPIEESRQVYFRIVVKSRSDAGILETTNQGNIKPITLQRSVPFLVYGKDLEEYLDLNILSSKLGVDKENRIPPGEIGICLQVIDLFRQEPLSREICATGRASLLDPPLLVFPENNARISMLDLPSQIFNWQLTDPRVAQLSPLELEYEFELRELPSGMNPQDAFDNFILVFKETIANGGRFIRYNQLSPLLLAGKQYAWRVRGKRIKNGEEIAGFFANNGYSMVRIFQTLDGVDNISPQSQLSCACTEAGCKPTPVTNQVVAGKISSEKTLKMGYFPVSNLSLTVNDGNALSGTATVKIDFLDINLNVVFSNLKVNANGEVFDGEIKVNGAVSSGLLVQTVNGTFSGMNPFSLDDKKKLLNEAKSAIAGSVTLPFSLKAAFEKSGLTIPEGSADLLVTDFRLTPLGALLDLVALIPDGNGGLIRFGASSVGITPNGLDMSRLLLFLAEDHTIPGLTQGLPVYLKKAISTDPAKGSFIAFDCGGFKSFNLLAEYRFPETQLELFSNSKEPVKANLVLTGVEWGKFLAVANIPKFKVIGLNDWSFEMIDATMDLDDTRNIEGITFPESYDATTLNYDWKGFYLGALKVGLPKGFGFGDDIPEISANNLLIDSLGISAELFALNILKNKNNGATWDFSIDTLKAIFLQNKFIDAKILGKVKVKILEAEVNYQGLIYLDSKTESFAFDLTTYGNFYIPWLKVKATILESSYISFKKPNKGEDYRPFAAFDLFFNFNIGTNDLPGFSALLDNVGIKDIGFGIDLNILGLKINHPDLDGPPKRVIDFTCMCDSKMYVSYGETKYELGLSDISYSDTITLGDLDVPGFSLDFEFLWENDILKTLFDGTDFGLTIFAKKVGDSYEFAGLDFRYPQLKDIITNPPIDEITEAIKNFKCKCDGSDFCNKTYDENFGPFKVNNNKVTIPFLNNNNFDIVDGNKVTIGISIKELIKSLTKEDVPFDIIIDSIVFKEGYGTASIRIEYKINEKQTLEFKLNTLKIRPDGFNMEDLRVILDKDFSF